MARSGRRRRRGELLIPFMHMESEREVDTSKCVYECGMKEELGKIKILNSLALLRCPCDGYARGRRRGNFDCERGFRMVRKE
jgi:hypothetical protein